MAGGAAGAIEDVRMTVVMGVDPIKGRIKKMSNVVSIDETNKPVARPLHVLVPLIKEDLKREQEAAAQAAMPYRIAA